MKRNAGLLILLLLLLSCIEVSAQVAPVPSWMNFQGRLTKPGGIPVPDGNYSLRFSLWSALTGGTEQWNQTINPINVRNGTFVVLLTGVPTGIFNGNLYLEIKIGTDAPLTPRQALVTAPYAFRADMALTVPDGSITNAKIATGTLTADKFAANIFNPLAWLLGGNSGTNPSSHFIGTTDNQPLVFKANNHRAMQYQYAVDQFNQYRGINVIGGSELNSIAFDVVGATIAGGGGRDNIAETDYPNQVTYIFGTVGGGRGNVASGDSATVAGGWSNTASGMLATVSGGWRNAASGEGATVAGGYLNAASGRWSFTAGRNAKANHNGTFVWADSTGADFASTTTNQFNVRAAGGVRIFSNSTSSTGVALLAGSGTWSTASDKNLKINFQNVDSLDILEKLLAMPLTTWNYKANTDIRHIGPMAQDFYVAFGRLGMDDKHIDTVDADGVALAAIQGLNRKLEAREKRIQSEVAELKAENAELKARNAELEARLERLEAALRNQKYLNFAQTDAYVLPGEQGL